MKRSVHTAALALALVAATGTAVFAQATPPAVAPEPAAEAVETVVAEPAPAGETYTVARGDNLLRIAKKFGVTTQEIMAANGMQNADRLEAGKVLTIPVAGQAAGAKKNK